MARVRKRGPMDTSAEAAYAIKKKSRLARAGAAWNKGLRTGKLQPLTVSQSQDVAQFLAENEPGVPKRDMRGNVTGYFPKRRSK